MIFFTRFFKFSLPPPRTRKRIYLIHTSIPPSLPPTHPPPFPQDQDEQDHEIVNSYYEGEEFMQVR